MITHRLPFRRLLCVLVLGSLLGGTGCQVSMNGQTLPSGYFLTDDVQYFPPGPEFKLSREAAAMKAFNAEEASRLERNRAR